MKKRYKVKEINKTKLKTYLKNADNKCNKGSRRNNSGQYNNIKRNDLY